MSIEQTPHEYVITKVVSVPDWVIAQQNPNYDLEQTGLASDECQDQGLVGLESQVADLNASMLHERSREKFYDPLIARRIRIDSPQTSFPLTRYEESREVNSEAQRHQWLALEQLSYGAYGAVIGSVAAFFGANNYDTEAYPSEDLTNLTAFTIGVAAIARVLIAYRHQR